jgi:hypothetical protein
MAISWDVVPCSLAEIDRRFAGSYCLHYQGEESVSTFETSISFYQTTRRNIPEAYYFQTRRRENLKCHK